MTNDKLQYPVDSVFDFSGGYSHYASAQLLPGDTGTPDGFMNGWAYASMAISAAQGWAGEGQDPFARKIVCVAVAMANPLISGELLMQEAARDDISLLRLTRLTREGLAILLELPLGMGNYATIGDQLVEKVIHF